MIRSLTVALALGVFLSTASSASAQSPATDPANREAVTALVRGAGTGYSAWQPAEGLIVSEAPAGTEAARRAASSQLLGLRVATGARPSLGTIARGMFSTVTRSFGNPWVFAANVGLTIGGTLFVAKVTGGALGQRNDGISNTITEYYTIKASTQTLNEYGVSCSPGPPCFTVPPAGGFVRGAASSSQYTPAFGGIYGGAWEVWSDTAELRQYMSAHPLQQCRAQVSNPAPACRTILSPHEFFEHMGTKNEARGPLAPYEPRVYHTVPSDQVLYDAFLDHIDEPEYDKARQWIDSELSPRCNANPTAATVTVPPVRPSETQIEYSECLDQLGLEPQVELGWSSEHDAGQVISSSPSGAQQSGTPIAVKVQGKRPCDRTPWLEDPYSGGAHDQWDPFTGMASWPRSSDMTIANGLAAATTIYWGNASPNADPEIEWQGFGYRKIAAKHGWGPSDDASTRSVLLAATPIPNPDGNERQTFRGDQFVGLDGQQCERVVVVEYEPNPGDAHAEGIVTSYGRTVTP